MTTQTRKVTFLIATAISIGCLTIQTVRLNATKTPVSGHGVYGFLEQTPKGYSAWVACPVPTGSDPTYICFESRRETADFSGEFIFMDIPRASLERDGFTK